jgi:hypothetical protein
LGPAPPVINATRSFKSIKISPQIFVMFRTLVRVTAHSGT